MDAEIDWKAESEKAVAKLQALKEHIRDFMVREQVKVELRSFGVIDAELVVKLADVSGCSFDEDSDVVIGAAAAVQQLVAEKPFLFAPKIKNPPPPKMRSELFDAVSKELGFKKF